MKIILDTSKIIHRPQGGLENMLDRTTIIIIGISANNVIDYGKSNGLVMIVTDHHIPDMTNLPNADILVNPVTNDK